MSRLNGESLRALEFVTHFNEIDAEIRRRLGGSVRASDSFKHAVNLFVKANRWWHDDGESMRALSDLRNVIVHENFSVGEYLSIPSEEASQAIRRIRDRLLKPPTVYQQFGRPVRTIGPDATVQTFLELVGEHQISQLPVITGSRFEGLVTGSGLTRWLSDHVRQEGGQVDFAAVTVSRILESEERRIYWGFVPRNMGVPEAVGYFLDNPELEALLITETGERHQKLLGILTQWDVRNEVENPAAN